ncbi:uncharacterized protein LOC129744594 [Uranotaenia lowii]|uniref:uncharacterized protein LOC129744594 n=1 Tax=Uranotaenia lowii TaxID=190385 RepID=UPI0024789D47|nr:uncharacterized protein LOC129744594 [Uranotaenia lowii]
MKSITILIAFLAFANAARQPAKDVIAKFREVAPKYLDLMVNGENELAKIRQEASENVAQFHKTIIEMKEYYIINAEAKEEGIHNQIFNQDPSVDRTCLGFLNTSLDMNMNLAGVGFTNCINTVDEQFNALITKYYKTLGVEESLIAELRLLDVFRGDNVFYTPENIIAKLNKKLEDLQINPESVGADMEKAKETFQQDLDAIRSNYKLCMTQTEQMLKNSADILMMQLTFNCQGQIVEV